MMATNSLVYGITVNNTHRDRKKNMNAVSRTGERAYTGLEAVPPVGSRGNAYGGRSAGKALRPQKLKAF